MITYMLAFGLHANQVLPISEPEAILEVCEQSPGSHVLELDGDNIKAELALADGLLFSRLLPSG